MNAIALAELLGVEVRFTGGERAQLQGDTIYVSSRSRHVRQQGLIAHELGHWALAYSGEPDSEEAAAYVGAALMLPRAHFDRDLKRTAWDLRELQAKHIHCSAEMIARRIASMRDACVTIWDQGRLKARIPSPWLPEPYRRISAFERELAAQVLESGETIKVDELVWGFPVFSGWHKRVITVAEAQQLALRY